MPIRPVLQLGDPLLRQRATRVADPTAREIHDLAQDLGDTLAHWRSATGYGRGIAAPQLGELRRVIFLKLPGEDPWPLINPEIIDSSEERIIVWDACLSFLSIFMQVSSATAGLRCVIRRCRVKRANSKPATSAISPNFSSTKSITLTVSSPSTASSM